MRASIEMKRHSLTFPCARTRLLLSMQHEKHSERLHPDQSGQATHQAMPLAHPTPWVLACDPLSHACLRHMLTDVTRVAAQSRLNATLSRTCSKPHHLAFRMSLHAPKHRRQNARLACARTEHYSANNAKIRRATVEEDRTTQAPSQMHLCQNPIMSHIPSRNANTRHSLARIASFLRA